MTRAGPAGDNGTAQTDWVGNWVIPVRALYKCSSSQSPGWVFNPGETDRSSGLVRPNTHAEELLYVVYWVPIPDGVGVDRGFKEGFLF